MKNIFIKISNRGIYTLVITLFIIALALGVNAYDVGNVYHHVADITGACADDGTGCEYIDDYYYTKAEQNTIFEDNFNACGWEGWDIDPSTECSECVGPYTEYGTCFVPIGECTCTYADTSSFCCAKWPNYQCVADLQKIQLCSNGVIISVDYIYINCRFKYLNDPIAEGCPLVMVT